MWDEAGTSWKKFGGFLLGYLTRSVKFVSEKKIGVSPDDSKEEGEKNIKEPQGEMGKCES